MNSAMIEAIVRDYLRASLTINVYTVTQHGFDAEPRQVPVVQLLLNGEVFSEAEAY